MIKINVRYVNDIGQKVNDDEIERIFLIFENKDVVFLSIETKHKYPEAGIYGDTSVLIKTLKNNYAIVKFNNIKFNNPVIISQSGRYNLYLLCFNDDGEGKQIYDINLEKAKNIIYQAPTSILPEP